MNKLLMFALIGALALFIAGTFVACGATGGNGTGGGVSFYGAGS